MKNKFFVVTYGECTRQSHLIDAESFDGAKKILREWIADMVSPVAFAVCETDENTEWEHRMGSFDFPVAETCTHYAVANFLQRTSGEKKHWYYTWEDGCPIAPFDYERVFKKEN